MLARRQIAAAACWGFANIPTRQAAAKQPLAFIRRLEFPAAAAQGVAGRAVHPAGAGLRPARRSLALDETPSPVKLAGAALILFGLVVNAGRLGRLRPAKAAA